MPQPIPALSICTRDQRYSRLEFRSPSLAEPRLNWDFAKATQTRLQPSQRLAHRSIWGVLPVGREGRLGRPQPKFRQGSLRPRSIASARVERRKLQLRPPAVGAKRSGQADSKTDRTVVRGDRRPPCFRARVSADGGCADHAGTARASDLANQNGAIAGRFLAGRRGTTTRLRRRTATETRRQGRLIEACAASEVHAVLALGVNARQP